MSFDQAIRSAFRNYANFNGRAMRSEYWYIVLFNTLMNVLLATPLWPLGLVLDLTMMIPALAAACRRLHDIGRSGWYLLVGMAAPVGTVFLIVWLCQEGQTGWNQYGADPRGSYAPNVPQPAPSQGPWALECVAGPTKGLIYTLGNGATQIGRSQSCAVVISGAAGVSRVHCSLRPCAGGMELTDLGSTYGTYLADGTQLPPNFPATLHKGDTFYVGSKNVMFRLGTAPNWASNK